MKKQILVVTKNNTELKEIIELINAERSWIAAGSVSVEEAIEKFHHYSIELVLLSGQLDSQDLKKLQALFTRQDPDILMLPFEKEQKPDLLKIIESAMEKKKTAKKSTIQVVDDPFPKGGLPIHIE